MTPRVLDPNTRAGARDPVSRTVGEGETVGDRDYRGTAPDHRDGRSLAWRVRQPLVPSAKRALRRYGTVTAGSRRLPDFLVIGAKRGGSTSLFRNLLQGPGFVPLFPKIEDLKGTYYFDVHHTCGERWYRSHFPSATACERAERASGGRVLVGEASPYYLAHPHAASRAAALIPSARVIALLRDPVHRAWSHYQERVRQGIETLPTFAEAIAAEPGRLEGELERMEADPAYASWNHLNFSYLAQGDYAAGLGRWLDHFPLTQICVVRSEDYYAEPAAVLNRVRGFLGLAAIEATGLVHYNRTVPPDMDPALEAELREHFRPSVRALEDRMGRSFDWV